MEKSRVEYTIKTAFKLAKLHSLPLFCQQEEHLKIALQLSVAEFEWLCQLPYFISSLDLGAALFASAVFDKFSLWKESMIHCVSVCVV